MKLSMHLHRGRRDLIRSIGSAALALPFLELFEREVKAQAVARKSKYVVFCYTPDGVNQSTFWPTGTETNFQLSPTLSPFEPYKDKILVLGPQMNGTKYVTRTGLTYGGGYQLDPPQHQAAVCLTGNPGWKPGSASAAGDGFPYGDQSTAVNRLDSPSIDQVIADAVVGDSLFSSLNFGIHPVGGDTPSDLNFTRDGTPLKKIASADEAWDRTFGKLVVDPGAGADLRKHTAVSDFLHARFAGLRTELSPYDRHVVDGHLASLRTYEDRKVRLLQSQNTQSPGQCAAFARKAVPTDETSVRTGADTQQLAPFYMDVISSAFACNMTKVASVSFGYPGGGTEGGLRMPWLGFTEPMHLVSHHDNVPLRLDQYRKMNTWIASQVAGLMQRLAAITDASGKTLLDQTTIYWFNRHGDGNSHFNDALPGVILGGTGGYFKMGRYLQMPATNVTQLLISIANAMGVDVPSFGKDLFQAKTPMAGLAA